ncbi:MAG: RidA family protein [Rhodospirillales bacterium]|jgi:2-iminobutanoate/2-iminopropanoate deaminase|nr:RidA family protein [Rhodospirillales bacterium]
MPKREVIAGKGIPKHHHPFATAVKMGNMVFSGANGGQDPDTGIYPKSIEEQVRNAFQSVRNILAKAGGSPDDIATMKVYLRNRDDRKYVNPVWLEMFPDENDRPVRHTIAAPLEGDVMIQLEFTAVL